jgi:hypothetical protein
MAAEEALVVILPVLGVLALASIRASQVGSRLSVVCRCR